VGKSLLVILIVLLGLADQLIAYHPSLVIEDAMPALTMRAQEILKRYYVIQHFHVRMQFVQRMQKQFDVGLDHFLSGMDASQLASKRVLAVMQAVREQQTLAPMLLFWDSYQSYAYIDDAALNKDMFVCMSTIIDILLMVQGDRSSSMRTLQLAQHESFDEVTILHILFRFYFLKKIDQSIRRLKKVPQGQIAIPTFFNTVTTLFKHPIIQSCAHEMVKARSIKPFFSAYSTLCSYDYLADYQLCREFLLFTLFILNAIHADMGFARISGDGYNSIQECIERELGLTKKQFITYLLRRMYHINRLLCAGSCTFPADQPVQRGAVKPLIFSWTDFNRYVHLDDQLLIDPYAQELFLLSEHMSLMAPDALTMNIPASQLLLKDFIAQDVHDIEIYASPEDIVRRFYYINRLEHIAHRILAYTGNCTVSAHLHADRFSHPAVIHACHAICQQSSLLPLKLLKDRFVAYYYLSDASFIRDYIMLLYGITSSITQQEGVCVNGMHYDEMIECIEEMARTINLNESDVQPYVSWWTLQIKKIDSYLSAVFHW